MTMSNLDLYRAATDISYFSADGEAYTSPVELRSLTKTLPLRVLSEQDFEFWQTYGYVVVREAISKEAASRLLDFTFEFQGMVPNDPESWYPEREFRSELERDLYVYGFVEAYHHQLLWESRQSQRVYDAFVDVWDCAELWVSLDRLNLNPPNVRNRDRGLIEVPDTGFDINLHWDVDTTLRPPPQRVQGIIALNDHSSEAGGFQCAPELFHRFDQWSATQPGDRDPYRPGFGPGEFPVFRPELGAGDLLVFNGMLAHGVAPNVSEVDVRAVQYVAMMPALESCDGLRSSRVESWRHLGTPTWNKTLVGDPVRPESQRYPTAVLNGLGARLLGLEPWREPTGEPSTGEEPCTGSV